MGVIYAQQGMINKEQGILDKKTSCANKRAVGGQPGAARQI